MFFWAWKKPEEFKKWDYMPFMDSYFWWNIYRLGIAFVFIVSVIAGVLTSAIFIYQLVRNILV